MIGALGALGSIGTLRVLLGVLRVSVLLQQVGGHDCNRGGAWGGLSVPASNRQHAGKWQAGHIQHLEYNNQDGPPTLGGLCPYVPPPNTHGWGLKLPAVSDSGWLAAESGPKLALRG